jgi:triosephosphate isomerase
MAPDRDPLGSTRRMIVGGNWKSNLTQAQALELVEQLNGMDVGDVEVVVAPVALHIPAVQSLLKRAVAVGAQNCGFAGMGAYTGEVSAEHLSAMSVPWVIIGHSERRIHYREDDVTLREKLLHALQCGLRVIFCIGESKAEREAGATAAVCATQLMRVMDLLDPARVVIAYEPVWAIGTGLTATPEQAQDTHAAIRAWLKSNYSAAAADKMVIQYGGSVTPETVDELMACPDIDGALVGGASLIGEKFARIVNFK